MKIWTVDAFTSKPYAGNPAAVIIVDDFPRDETGFKIASEMNLSETAFVKPLARNRFHIRWFTPEIEVDLCGHATLASSHILFQEKLAEGNKISFESLSGPLFVYRDNSQYTLDFPLQKNGEAMNSSDFSGLLGIEVLSATKAINDLIVEVSKDDLINFKPQKEKLEALGYRALIMTAKDGSKYDFISRFFAPDIGVLEDPVTGSAHCKLVDYWQKKLGKTEFLAYQASKRGGELKLSIHADRVYITGSAVTVMQGEWLV